MSKLALCLGLLWGATLVWATEPQRIEVQVEVTEVDHAKASRLGVNWIDNIQVVENPVRDILELGPVFRSSPLKADVQFLAENGAAELLANPNLVTDSGTTASFHAGGEIPYLTTTSLGSVNVNFKAYGILLKVQPKVLKNGLIKMKVQAEVSSPDQANGVILSGNTVPALLEREVMSHVTLSSGETLALAGLVQTIKEKTVQGIPFLRRIPLLGFFFRWTKRNYRRTTIVMFVTPTLIDTDT